MFRVGIMGSDNTHALAFAKLYNFENPETGKRDFPDIKIVGIYGKKDEENRKVFEEGGLEFIAEKPEDFFGKVDAMMVDFRHGDLHAEHILPFVEAGMPCFIDKPFTIKMEEAYSIVDAAKKSGAPIMGGSSCKLVEDVQQLKALVADADNEVTGRVLTGCVNYPGDTHSEYAGLFFYGPHLTEVALTIFGYDVKSVIAVDNDGPVTAILRYGRYDVSLLFSKNDKDHGCMLVGEKGNHYRTINYDGAYKAELEHFADMLRTGKSSQCTEMLVKPVAVLNALVTSIKTGKEVAVSDFER
nr:Gfo/Idh/MocA family oxidoreductase [bacterium]